MGVWKPVELLHAHYLPYSNFILMCLGGIKKKTSCNQCWWPQGLPMPQGCGSGEAAQVDENLRVWASCAWGDSSVLKCELLTYPQTRQEPAWSPAPWGCFSQELFKATSRAASSQACPHRGDVPLQHKVPKHSLEGCYMCPLTKAGGPAMLGAVWIQSLPSKVCPIEI